MLLFFCVQARGGTGRHGRQRGLAVGGVLRVHGDSEDGAAAQQQQERGAAHGGARGGARLSLGGEDKGCGSQQGGD